MPCGFEMIAKKAKTDIRVEGLLVERAVVIESRS